VFDFPVSDFPVLDFPVLDFAVVDHGRAWATLPKKRARQQDGLKFYFGEERQVSSMKPNHG
jgi:hypothetical protein